MPTCYLKHWGKKGVFAKLWKLASEEYNELVGLDWIGACKVSIAP
jgi:hypothetical protein